MAISVRWLRKEERKDRAQLEIEKTFANPFDRGYHLGRAHAFNDTAYWLRRIGALRGESTRLTRTTEAVSAPKRRTKR